MKNLKISFKVLALLMTAVICFSLTACGKTSTGSEGSDTVVEYEGLELENADNQGGTNSSATGGNNSTGGSGNSNATVGGDVTVQKGDKGMEEGLNFGGKTYTMAVDGNQSFETTSFNATISAFEKKFNCKITKKEIPFHSYNTYVANQMATGKSYDILFIHGSFFPGCVINNLTEDLTKYITTADLIGSDPTKGGIDLEKSKNFSWNGGLYALCDWKSQNPYLFYYNKQLFKQYNLEDPMELYNKGQWTWDKIFEMGAKVTDKNAKQYFLSGQFGVQFYGVSQLSIENGKVVEKISNATYYKSLLLYKRIFDEICEPWVDNAPVQDGFYSGTSFIYSEESSKWADLAPNVAKSFAFDKTTDNLGIVPWPMTAENKDKLYPCGWYTGVAAGKGSDARVAVAWAKFSSSFASPVKDKYPMRDSDVALLKKLQSGKLISNRHGTYNDSTNNTTNLTEKILSRIRSGDDISTAVNDIRPQIIACIEATVGKGNYLSK